MALCLKFLFNTNQMALCLKNGNVGFVVKLKKLVLFTKAVKMTEIKNFLKEINDLTALAKSEIQERKTNVEITVALGKFHKALDKQGRTFKSPDKNDLELSKHAISQAKKELTTKAVGCIVELGKEASNE